MAAGSPDETHPSRADREVARRLFLCLFVLYAGFAPGSFKSSDEWTVYEAAVSIADTGRPTVGQAPYTYAGVEGHRYGQYALGQSLLALPFLWAGRAAERGLPDSWSAAIAGRKLPARGPVRAGGTPEIAFVTLFAPVVLALLGVVFFALQREIGVSMRSALSASGLVCVTTYVAAHATFFLRHGTTTLLLLLALLGFQRHRRTTSRRALLLGAAAASAIPLVRIPDALLGLPLAALVGWMVVETWRRGGAAALRGAAPLVALPAMAALACDLASNRLRWGSWFESPIFTQASSFGGPMLEGLRGFLLSPGGSVFAYSPLLLLAPLAMGALARRERGLAVFAVGTSIWLLLFHCKFVYWPGLPTAPGPRYLYAVTPLLLLSLGPWLDERRRAASRVALAALAAAGLAVQLGLLLADWHRAIGRLGGTLPPYDWMMDPARSPIRAAWLAVAGGDLNPWLWRLGEGWPGFAPRPALAAALALVWLATLGLCVRSLVRAARV